MTDQAREPEAEATQAEELPGYTLVEVHMRLFLDEDGDIDHDTYIDRHEGTLPPQYAALGAWEMAKDKIKEQYWEEENADCDCEGCWDGDDCDEED